MSQQECLIRLFLLGLVWGQWNCDRENDQRSRGGKCLGWSQSRKKRGKARNQNKKRKQLVPQFAKARR